MTTFHTSGSLKFKSKSTKTNTAFLQKSLDSKTQTEIAFEQQRKQTRSMKNPRLSNSIQKTNVKKSHKDRINEFNSYLEKLPEHNDIPRIGPG